MEFERNEDGSLKLDDKGNPIVKSGGQLESLATLMKQQNEMLTNSLAEMNSNFTQSLSAINERINSADNSPPARRITDDDLEELSRGELVQHIIEQVNAANKPVIEEIKSSLDNTITTNTQNRIADEIKEFKKTHKDFDDWKPEMLERIKANPQLSISDAYTLVRSSDTEKAKMLDDKYKEPPADNDVSDNKPTPFGGLRPGKQGSEQPPTNLSKDESVNAAWDEVMGDVSDADLAAAANS